MKNVMPRVAAIHDLSGFGRCALTVVIPVLSAMGNQVCPLPTAILSTHSGGFDNFTFSDFTGGMEAYAGHWKELGIKFDCIYSGFLGSAEQIGIVSRFIDDFGTGRRSSEGECLVVVDPVMGDDGILYKTYTEEMKNLMKNLIKKAAVITPNYTEACFLTGSDYKIEPLDKPEVEAMLKELCSKGPEMAVITTVNLRGSGFINAGYSRREERFCFVGYNPVPASYPGTGELFASVFTGRLLKGSTLKEAIQKATDHVSQTAAITYRYGTPAREGVMLEKTLKFLIPEDDVQNNRDTRDPQHRQDAQNAQGTPDSQDKREDAQGSHDIPKDGCPEEAYYESAFSRTVEMVGGNGIKILRESRICILGIGGVGSYAAEALTRCGIGNFTLIDPEDIDISNINRQIHAMENTIGRPKVEVMKERMLQINPYIHVRTIKKKYLPGSPENPDINEFSYIVDAIDDITAKADLAEKAYKEGIPMISSMGAGNKMDPSLFEAADIYDTSVCPLARAMRRELRKRGVMKLKVVYSKEEPLECGGKAPSSISFVPSAAGLVIASEVVRDLIKED